jgi:aromatic ring-opening dioxygenase catalytic subunit (LigB family)
MNTATNNSDNARIIPMLFVSHGSPMNAIEANGKMKSFIVSYTLTEDYYLPHSLS